MPSITINGKEIEVADNITLIQACEIAGVEVPRFCYHERLAVAGNCRMCLVEVEGGPPKPVASCATPVVPGMKVKTDSEMVKKAREGVMEFLLANHPLDCPICDQGGECDLQDQAYVYGRDSSRFEEHKRAVEDKNMGPLIATNMTRCIHCTRCVRFTTDVAGVEELGAINRGEHTEITSYLQKSISSELSGNVIDLCPVGALTSKPYAFRARSWELKKTPSIDIMDGVGSNIRIDSRGIEVMRILPDLNEEINEEWISDKTRFCYDALKYQRLDKAYVKKDGKLVAVSLEEAYKAIADKLKNLQSDEIAALSGNLSAVEDILSLKILLQKLGCDQFDCREEKSAINPKNRASYVFNSKISGIDLADSCLIIGSNIRHDAPIINARIRKRYLSGNLKIATIGVDTDLTYKNSNLGNSIQDLKDIISGTSSYCKILQNSKRPILILGSNILNQSNGAEILSLAMEIAHKYNFVSEDFNGFNLLHDNSSIVGALDIGFISQNSAIHRASILEKCESKKIKLLYLLGDDSVNPIYTQNSFVVYQGSHGDAGAAMADVILPAATYTEKDAIYVNTEGRPQTTTRAVFAPGDAKEDWQLILNIANNLGIDLGFKDLASLRAIASSINPIFANINSVAKNNWELIEKPKAANDNQEINCRKNNFFKSNIIAKNSKILDNCHKELSRQ